MERLEGSVAVVTGAGSGIGAACVERLAAEGAVVVTLDIAGDVDHHIDVRDETGIEAMFRSVVDEHGHLDVVVNAAGVIGGGPVHLIPEEEWDRVVDINLKGTFLVDKHSLRPHAGPGPRVHHQYRQHRGSRRHGGGSAYNASKGGVVMLTKSMAIDYGRRGIRVNCICPGGIDTPMLRSVTDLDGLNLYQEKLREEHLLGRFGRPSEIAAAAAFLASEDASFITGHALVVDGGFTAGLRVGLLEQLGM